MLERYILRFFLPLLALALTACNEDGQNNELSIYVCDSPAEYQGVTFSVRAVEVRSRTEWTTLQIEDGTVSLLDLVNGRMQKVAGNRVPDGARYDAVRFTFQTTGAFVRVGTDSFEMEVDDQYAVQTIEAEITMNGDNNPVLFDIDAAASVLEIDEETYVFRPRIRWIDLDQYGAVQGGLQNGTVAMTHNALMKFENKLTGEVFHTYSDMVRVQGGFFIRLPAADYRLTITPFPDDNLQPEIFDITVVVGEVVDFGMIVLEKEPVEEEGEEDDD